MDDDRLRLAPQRQLARRLERETVMGEGSSRLGCQDGPGRRGGEKTRRRVHGIAGHGVRGPGAPAEVPGHHRTRVDPHVERDWLADALRPLATERLAALE